MKMIQGIRTKLQADLDVLVKPVPTDMANKLFVCRQIIQSLASALPMTCGLDAPPPASRSAQQTGSVWLELQALAARAFHRLAD
eukprot:scaffold370846_cov22-Prasinocladus_malaysianus.AAC.3